jgi:hypothetical protein
VRLGSIVSTTVNRLDFRHKQRHDNKNNDNDNNRSMLDVNDENAEMTLLAARVRLVLDRVLDLVRCSRLSQRTTSTINTKAPWTIDRVEGNDSFSTNSTSLLFAVRRRRRRRRRCPISTSLKKLSTTRSEAKRSISRFKIDTVNSKW